MGGDCGGLLEYETIPVYIQSIPVLSGGFWLCSAFKSEAPCMLFSSLSN